MSKILWKSLLFGPALLGAALTLPGQAVASETATASEPLQSLVTPALTTGEATTSADLASSVSMPNWVAQNITPANNSNSSLNQVLQYSKEGRARRTSLGQVTSVSQLRDVQPTDWAFQALQSLVERYGCIAGYPDGTYRGNRAMTRYEFAAGLNACLDRISELIAQSTANFVTKEDLATLQRLQEEFAAELATLRGRVDALEARTAELEANQFSTTTKLVGEAIFALTDSFGDDYGDELGSNGGDHTVFQSRVRLNFNTSFTGKDLLVTRLETGNAQDFSFQPGIGYQTFNYTQNNNNVFALDKLHYIFNLNPGISVYVSAVGGTWDDFVPTLNPYLEDFDGGNGSLSTFGQRNALYRIGGGSGAGLNFNLGRTGFLGLGGINLTMGYLADQGNDPADKAGLFNGDYAALGQLTFTPTNNFSFALTYVHGYHTTNNLIFDSGRDNLYTGTLLTAVPSLINPTVTNSYGAEVSLRLSPKFLVSGWFGYSDVKVIGRTDGEMWTYALNLIFPDLGKAGNVLGIVAGAPPYLPGLDDLDIEKKIPFHVEAFYKYQVTNNISITPGVIWVMNPLQRDDDDDVIIGTVRTTFNF